MQFFEIRDIEGHLIEICKEPNGAYEGARRAALTVIVDVPSFFTHNEGISRARIVIEGS